MSAVSARSTVDCVVGIQAPPPWTGAQVPAVLFGMHNRTFLSNWCPGAGGPIWHAQ
jgi:hypothetical protein